MQRLPTPPAVGRKTRTAGVAGAGEAFALAEFARRRQDQPLLFIARDVLSASHLFEELAFFAPDLAVKFLPDWDVLPYDLFSPTPEIVAARIGALSALLDGGGGLTIVPAPAMLLPYAPPSFIAAHAFQLRVGERLSLTVLLRRLGQGGYRRVERVLSPGEFAVYGGQIDVYPPDQESPFRLVLLDDEIEQIRLFDPETQRSVERVEAIRTLPFSECDLSDDGIALFRAAFLAAFDGNHHAEVYKAVEQQHLAAGAEFYLPLFHTETGRLFDYLNDDTVILMHRDGRDHIGDFLRQARVRQKMVGVYENRPTLAVNELMLNDDDFYRRLRDYSVVELDGIADDSVVPPVAVNPRQENSHRALLDFIQGFDGRIIIAVDSVGRRDALASVLSAAGVQAHIAVDGEDCRHHRLSLTVAFLRGGFILPEARLALLTETDIFETPVAPRRERHRSAVGESLHIGEIQDGDLVVHRDYGVGRAHRLKNLTVGGKEGEFLEIEYAEEQRLWLPIAQLHLLERHHGGAELSKMGGGGWRRLRRRAEKNAHDTAVRLLEINARRAAADARGHHPDETQLAKFIEQFAYMETPDQDRAAREVIDDLRADKPMDRLLAADVGFGKTEIAMRAAAAVVFAGSQAAILAPTTLLAEQHYRSFTNRFADFPVRMASLTRFIPTAQRRQTLLGLADGTIDIIIGTHALLQKTVRYKQLGLVVVDEEHRFGVRHKEQLKKIRADVDLLALSATPIPRTLSMALGGIRDLSIMSTPPSARLPIKPIFAPLSRVVVTEACERELLRGGQIFFIHNEIRSITEMAETIAQWLPRARLIIAHGGMNAAQLENAMRRFLRREADILLCTTIVESGLDITNANTIIINRADRMGLSRLHQLRGRVGRGGMQAYAYFLIPSEADISQKAEARLAAAHEYNALGGGFFLSMRDLEIRGAGELLGERQSGDLKAVGCSMYQKMVNAAARQLRGEPELETDIAAAVAFLAPALLPSAYVPSPAERMRHYRRLAAARDNEALDEIFLEWDDRFGKPPPAAQLLKESHRLRILARGVMAENIQVNKNQTATLTFAEQPSCADRLLEKITIGACSPSSPNAVRLVLESAEPIAQARQIGHFFRTLTKEA